MSDTNINLNNAPQTQGEYGADTESIQAFSLMELVMLMLKKWYWFAISIVICLCAGYYYVASTPKVYKRQATILINKNHLEMWGITGEELDRQAWENTVSDLKASLRPMGEILRECFLNADVDVAKTEDEAEYRIFPMYVLTNQKKTFGAICIRYPGMLKELSEKFGGDFYILPSSVHECILVPADETVSRDMLKEMVTDINQTQVEPQEILANQAYLYSRTLNQIVF